MIRKEVVEYLHDVGYSRRLSAKLADIALLVKSDRPFEFALRVALEKSKKFSPSVYKHSNKPGAGAKKRKGLKPDDKVRAVMGEFKRKTLHSGGSGKIVTKRSQAIAIAMGESGQSKDGGKK